MGVRGFEPPGRKYFVVFRNPTLGFSCIGPLSDHRKEIGLNRGDWYRLARLMGSKWGLSNKNHSSSGKTYFADILKAM